MTAEFIIRFNWQYDIPINRKKEKIAEIIIMKTIHISWKFVDIGNKYREFHYIQTFVDLQL